MPDNKNDLGLPTPPVWTRLRWRRIGQIMGAILLGIVLGTSVVVVTVVAVDVEVLILDALHTVLTTHYCVVPVGR